MSDLHLSPLVADVLTAMTAQTQATTNALIEALIKRAEVAEAELAAVRAGVGRLLSGPWMPMPHAIEGALWPSRETVDRHRRAET